MKGKQKMEREQLLKGLNEAQGLMNQIITLQDKLAAQLQQFRKAEECKKPLNKMICCLMCFCVVWIFPGNILAGVIGVPINAIFRLDFDAQIAVANTLNVIISGVLGLIIGLWLNKTLVRRTASNNEVINQNNHRIEEYNKQLNLNNESLKKEIYHIQQQYAQNVAPWYPPNYCTLDAVEFFRSAVANYRANNVGEMVNLYEDYLHKNRLEQGQQQMIKQQKLNNILQVGSIMMQGATIGAINKNTDAVTGAVNRNTDAVTGAVNKNTNTLKDIRNILRK